MTTKPYTYFLVAASWISLSLSPLPCFMNNFSFKEDVRNSFSSRLRKHPAYSQVTNNTAVKLLGCYYPALQLSPPRVNQTSAVSHQSIESGVPSLGLIFFLRNPQEFFSNLFFYLFFFSLYIPPPPASPPVY